MKRILIVEDEPELQELLCAYLQDAGYAAAVAGDGAAALDLFRAQSFDLVLLDIMLPKIDGFGVCAQIRRQSQVPILMLTALDGETQQLRGFGLNIDDYVTKPFSMPVLLEKIRVILRRSGEAAESRLHYRDLVVDLAGTSSRAPRPAPHRCCLRPAAYSIRFSQKAGQIFLQTPGPGNEPRPIFKNQIMYRSLPA